MTTVAYPPVTATATGRASRPVWRVLARAESRQLIRHPGFVAGCAAMSAILVLATVAGVDFSTLALSGFACLPLGVGTFVAANLAARRDARSGTEELLDPLPGPPAVRTAAQLAAVAAAPLVAVVAVAVTFIVVTALGGPEVRFTGGIRQRPPSFPELAQGPMAVAVLGLAGVAVGRLVPIPLVAPVLAGILVFSMWPEGQLRWFAPVVNPALTVPGGYWPHPEIAPRTELVGFDVASLGWHLLYLGGLGALAASLALARHRLTPATASVAAVTFAAAAVGGVLQLR
jgi:hypothetical protein